MAATGLSKTLLMFDSFFDVEKKARAGNEHAKKVLQSWADAEWFTSRPTLAEKITVTVFKVCMALVKCAGGGVVGGEYVCIPERASVFIYWGSGSQVHYMSFPLLGYYALFI